MNWVLLLLNQKRTCLLLCWPGVGSDPADAHQLLHLVTAGNQRHRHPGADPQRAGPHDGDPADLPTVEGQQQPVYETEPPHLIAAVRPTGGIPAEPGGTGSGIVLKTTVYQQQWFSDCLMEKVFICDTEQPMSPDVNVAPAHIWPDLTPPGGWSMDPCVFRQQMLCLWSAASVLTHTLKSTSMKHHSDRKRR